MYKSKLNLTQRKENIQEIYRDKRICESDLLVNLLFILLQSILLKAKYVLAPLALSLSLFQKHTPLYAKLFWPIQVLNGECKIS